MLYELEINVLGVTWTALESQDSSDFPFSAAKIILAPFNVNVIGNLNCFSH